MPAPNPMRSFPPILNLTLLASSLALSACVGDQAITADARPIAIDQSAAATGPALGTSAAAVAQLQPSTSLTYVTLTVAHSDATTIGGNNGQTVPITSGSGFVISSDGYVVTAAHVAVAVGNEISARAADERIYTGVVRAIDRGNDLALIKLRAFNGRAAVPAAPACQAKDALVFTYGKPHGRGDTARVGSLQSMHFGKPVAYGSYGYQDAMVLHMGTQRGESGGPVFNGQGQLIGMVVSTLSDANGQSINMAHAQHSNTIARFVCANGACSTGWQNLMARPVDNCG
jgi:S1-C subfamily serine protease